MAYYKGFQFMNPEKFVSEFRSGDATTKADITEAVASQKHSFNGIPADSGSLTDNPPNMFQKTFS